MDAWVRAKSLFSLRRIWGLGLILLGLPGQIIHLGWLSLDVFGRLDILWRVVESMGGSQAMVASVIASWQLSLTLIIVGLGYTIFVGEPKAGVQRHPSWPYIAAIVFFVSLAAIASLSIYGAYELKLREAYAAGAAGIPRDTSPSNPQTPSNQRPLFVGSPRVLTPDQQRLLITQGGKMRADFPVQVVISYLETDMEAFSYASQFKTTFARAAIATSGVSAQPLEQPDQAGVMIEVPDKASPSPIAVKLQQLLLIADIQAPFVESKHFGATPCVLFIGPLPLQR